MKKVHETKDLATSPVLSQSFEANGLVFVSGQIHADADWKLVGDSVGEKLDTIFANIRAILHTAELTLDDIVKVTVYVTDMAQMPEINEHYATFFSAPFPAREAVCVNELPLGATIEISVIAAR
jgi:2-iminobutanoate/2-iminopropanoate deaminase